MKFKFRHFISLTLSALLITSSAVSTSAYAQTETVTISYNAASHLSVAQAESYSQYAEVIDVLADGIRNFKDKIDIARYNVKTDDDSDVFSVLRESHPELINLSNQFRYSYYGDKIQSFVPVYMFGADKKDDYFTPYNNMVEGIVSKANALPDDTSKVLFVHDYLASECEYATEVYDPDIDEIDPFVYNAYGCIVNQHSVCQGYSFAFKDIMNRLSIDAGYASSDAMNHMWNTVTIDGETYHVDVTFDDPIPNIIGSVHHDNFLCTDSEISASEHHDWLTDSEISSAPIENAYWEGITSKICFDGEYAYYAGNGLEKRSLATGETVTIPSALTGAKWNTMDGTGYYPGDFSCIELVGDTIYFSLPDGVCSINKDGTNEARLYTLPDNSDGRVYGFAIKNGKFYIQICESPVDSGRIEELPLEPLPEPTTSEPATSEPVEETTSSSAVTEPSSAATSKPVETEPTETSSAATSKPVETEPTEPSSAATSKPAETEPTEPSSAATSKPAETEPTEPSSTATSKPVETESTEPSSSDVPTKPTETEPTTPSTSEPDVQTVLLGDVNHDGLVNIDDVTYLQMHLAGYKNSDGEPLIDTSDSFEVETADYDKNGVIDINDATAIQRYLVGF